jgi:hypothetical protein
LALFHSIPQLLLCEFISLMPIAQSLLLTGVDPGFSMISSAAHQCR